MQIIKITDDLRLRPYDHQYQFALKWYQDREFVDLVDGRDSSLYDLEKLKRMYTYLNKEGELYFIEVKQDEVFIPIGDVTFCREDLPIVIGDKAYWGKGIGTMVIAALKEHAKLLGYTQLKVREIYSYNSASQRLFEKEGFKKCQATDKGYSYICRL